MSEIPHGRDDGCCQGLRRPSRPRRPVRLAVALTIWIGGVSPWPAAEGLVVLAFQDPQISFEAAIVWCCAPAPPTGRHSGPELWPSLRSATRDNRSTPPTGCQTPAMTHERSVLPVVTETVVGRGMPRYALGRLTRGLRR